MIIFDIETGPNDKALEFFEPPEPPPHPGEFDESAVKIGNLKDEAKIAAKIQSAREAHAAAVADYDRKTTEQLNAARSTFLADAGLSAITGRIICIGYLSQETGKVIVDAGEVADGEFEEFRILRNFWSTYYRMHSSNRAMVGHHIHGFDLPFVCQRSVLLDVDIPEIALKSDRYWCSTFVDTYVRWSFGQYRAKGSLDVLDKAMGGPGKLDGVTGADFARLWDTDRPKAIEYLEGDLRATARVAGKLGIA